MAEGITLRSHLAEIQELVAASPDERVDATVAVAIAALAVDALEAAERILVGGESFSRPRTCGRFAARAREGRRRPVTVRGAGQLKGDWPLLTVADAAKLLGVSKRTIERVIGDGRLPCLRLRPTIIRIAPDELEAFRQQRRRKGHAS